jgi:hypothetical protein
MWISANALDKVEPNRDSYLNPETLECMRKVTVWTHPTTGQAMRRYREFEHVFSPWGNCIHCGFSL